MGAFVAGSLYRGPLKQAHESTLCLPSRALFVFNPDLTYLALPVDNLLLWTEVLGLCPDGYSSRLIILVIKRCTSLLG